MPGRCFDRRRRRSARTRGGRGTPPRRSAAPVSSSSASCRLAEPARATPAIRRHSREPSPPRCRCETASRRGHRPANAQRPPPSRRLRPEEFRRDGCREPGRVTTAATDRRRARRGAGSSPRGPRSSQSQRRRAAPAQHLDPAGLRWSIAHDAVPSREESEPVEAACGGAYAAVPRADGCSGTGGASTTKLLGRPAGTGGRLRERGGVPIFFVQGLYAASWTWLAGGRRWAAEVGLLGADHGEDDVAAPSGEADERRVVPLTLGSLSVIEGLGLRSSKRRECGEEHGVLESVIASPALRLAVDRLAGLACHRGQTGVRGQLVAVHEACSVADLGQDPRPGPRTYPGHGREQLTERVGQERLLDLGGEGVAAGEDPVELTCELSDHSSEGGLGGDRHRLSLEGSHHCRNDLGDEAGRSPLHDLGRSGPGRRLATSWDQVLNKQVSHTGLVQPGPECSLKDWRDAGECVTTVGW